MIYLSDICKSVQLNLFRNFPGGSDGKASACKAEDLPDPWVRKILWRRKWQPTPVLLPGESHGQRSLVGHSPWGCKSQTRLSDFTFTFFHLNWSRLIHFLNYYFIDDYLSMLWLLQFYLCIFMIYLYNMYLYHSIVKLIGIQHPLSVFF